MLKDRPPRPSWSNRSPGSVRGWSLFSWPPAGRQVRRDFAPGPLGLNLAWAYGSSGSMDTGALLPLELGHQSRRLCGRRRFLGDLQWHAVGANSRSQRCLLRPDLALFLLLGWMGARELAGGVEGTTSVTSWGIRIGRTLVATAALIVALDPAIAASGQTASDVMLHAAAFVGSVILTVSLVLRGERRLSPWALLASAACLLFFGRFLFLGFGRLNVVTLALCIAIRRACVSAIAQ